MIECYMQMTYSAWLLWCLDVYMIMLDFLHLDLFFLDLVRVCLRYNIFLLDYVRVCLNDVCMIMLDFLHLYLIFLDLVRVS